MYFEFMRFCFSKNYLYKVVRLETEILQLLYSFVRYTELNIELF